MSAPTVLSITDCRSILSLPLAVAFLIVGFAVPGVVCFLCFFRRLYLCILVIVFFPQLDGIGLPVGHLAHGSARRGLEDRRILLHHLRACGRLFRLGFLLFLVVVLCAGELRAERERAVEGAFLLMQPFDALRCGRGPVGHTPRIIPQKGQQNAAKKKAATLAGCRPCGYSSLLFRNSTILVWARSAALASARRSSAL